MTATRSQLRPVWAVVFVSLAAVTARADEPTDEVLRLVPPETRICLVVRDLRTHVRSLQGSPFEKWLEQSALGKQLREPAELAKIQQLDVFLKSQFGVGFDQILDDILGDSIVLAYQPGPPGKPEGEAGVVFVNARKPEVLTKLFEKLNEFQKKTGEIKSVRPLSFNGQQYFEREKSDGGREYYLIRGSILVFSGQEHAIRQVIEQMAAAPAKSSRVASGIAALELAKTCVVCWFDPRGFDAELATKTAAAKDDGERAFLTQFSKVWAATDEFAMYLQPGHGLDLGVVAHFDHEKLPPEARELIAPTAGSSALWSVIPDDAILAIGGRLDVPRLRAGIESILPPEGKAGFKKAIEEGLAPVVGRDKLPAVLAGLGPDWAVWISPPPTNSEAVLPEWTAALKITDSPRSGVEVSRVVLQAVDFAAQMIRVAYNRDHTDQMDLTDQTQEGYSIKVLSNAKAFPAGFQPSYGLRSGYLVIASSPERVRRFQSPMQPVTKANTPLMRFSPKHFRNYMEGHQDGIVKLASKWSGKSPAELKQGLVGLSAVLEAFDRIELHRTTRNDLVKLSLHVDFVKPLTK